jgi:hypothetical protein
MMSGDHIYRGTRDTDNTTSIIVDGQPLPWTQFAQQTTDAWDWGHAGQTPLVTAHAILAYEFGDAYADRHYQAFGDDIIATLPSDGWTLTSADIRRWCQTDQILQPPP